MVAVLIGISGLLWADYVGYLALGIMPSPFYRLCQAEILTRLSAPSTFKAIEVAESTTQLPYDTYRAELEGQSIGPHFDWAAAQIRDIEQLKKWAVREGSPAPTFKKHVLSLTYDAQNAFGAPVRNAGECEFVQTTSALPEGLIGQYLVKLDGFTHFEFMAAKLKQAQQN